MQTYIKVEKLYQWYVGFGSNNKPGRCINPLTNISNYVAQNESLMFINITHEGYGRCHVECEKTKSKYYATLSENEVRFKFIPCLNSNSTYSEKHASSWTTGKFIVYILHTDVFINKVVYNARDMSFTKYCSSNTCPELEMCIKCTKDCTLGHRLLNHFS